MSPGSSEFCQTRGLSIQFRLFNCLLARKRKKCAAAVGLPFFCPILLIAEEPLNPDYSIQARQLTGLSSDKCLAVDAEEARYETRIEHFKALKDLDAAKEKEKQKKLYTPLDPYIIRVEEALRAAEKAEDTYCTLKRQYEQRGQFG